VELHATRDAVVMSASARGRDSPPTAATLTDLLGREGGEKFQEGLARPDVVLSNRMKNRRLLPDKKPLQAETDRALT